MSTMTLSPAPTTVTAHIEGVRDGRFTSWTLDEYCSRFTGQPADDRTG